MLTIAAPHCDTPVSTFWCVHILVTLWYVWNNTRLNIQVKWFKVRLIYNTCRMFPKTLKAEPDPSGLTKCVECIFHVLSPALFTSMFAGLQSSSLPLFPMFDGTTWLKLSDQCISLLHGTASDHNFLYGRESADT